jgi:hypothetical protein
MTSTAATAPIGSVIADKNAGLVRIQIIKAVDGYTVITWAGVEQVPGWCHSYKTWDETRAAANHARDAFRQHLTPAVVEQRRNRLAIDRAHTADRQARSRTPWIYDDQIERIDAEMAALEDLTTRALRPQMVAAVTAHLTKAA